MLVKQILSSKSDNTVITIAPSATISEAAALLAARRIGSVVVSEDGETALGMLSERDIVRELGNRGPACMSDSVSQMMTADPVTCQINDSVEKIMQTMTDRRFRHLPVVQDGRMVGIVTIGDAVKARLSELSMEKSALEGMIMGH
ncbi:histidine kinase [Brevirhabdus pacifica]|uniref:Histidine kinase n=1 Tax=Brevirhabdus pacifica TaxID=1267768 RepID=A0A1U7DLG6_9RHOB|nr:CBS domain-containing protein [Brevirhabdus pacifica]APX90718.1 histidine kinase [Brevirhabdus pacifica]OWU78309.1 histidine kinase [Loktanella sp. 22II-4b]PJJ85126.1 CBS domain protein [Brevirhabdus pacifica]